MENDKLNIFVVTKENDLSSHKKVPEKKKTPREIQRSTSGMYFRQHSTSKCKVTIKDIISFLSSKARDHLDQAS
uniref:Uncharacterized protein n=1 Tax=Arundo donax TaxID=35708 RepID=A0A0A9HSI7_ARUDO